MKRPIDANDDQTTGGDKKMKKTEPQEEIPALDRSAFVLTDENLLYEVLKNADARTLATAARVSRQWRRTAEDERLWELICTRHWTNHGGNQQLRHVVLALGGFRRLYSKILWPLSKPSSTSSLPSSAWPCLPPPPPRPKPSASTSGTVRWGKDEVHLSLSLLSIRYYEKMNFSNRSK